ncbi:putative glutamyl-tRNA synthetase [Zopfochytrium polystomum]|nr:putative glutamyl-tRNA synthetase [Zopfochytrium polystomum]
MVVPRPTPPSRASTSLLRTSPRRAHSSHATRGIRSQPVVVRFAPSPTGELHLGGLRTALYNYLLAKQTGGKFILRIEDTDQTRIVPGAAERLMEMLRWAGIEWDEGPDVGGPKRPYIQSKRLQIYQSFADKLLRDGLAYRCCCTPERLESLRAYQMATKSPIVGYDRHCRFLSKKKATDAKWSTDPFTIRMKIQPGTTVVDDVVLGKLKFSNANLDDSVIMKSDGFPTYHLANVVDDYLMGVTHVIRGNEWVPSTPKHVILYHLIGAVPPTFAHLPLLVNKDGTKLSKRDGATNIELLKNNYFPEAVRTFAATLGWSGNSNMDPLTMEDLIEKFSLDQISKSPAIVSYEQLDSLNKRYLRASLQSTDDPSPSKGSDIIPNQLTERENIIKQAFLQQPNLGITDWGSGRLDDANYFKLSLGLVQPKSRSTKEVCGLLVPFFVDPDPSTCRQLLQTAEQLPKIVQVLETIDDWSRPTILQTLKDFSHSSTDRYVPLKDVRSCVTGSKVGAELGGTLELLGKEAVIRRIQAAIQAHA